MVNSWNMLMCKRLWLTKTAVRKWGISVSGVTVQKADSRNMWPKLNKIPLELPFIPHCFRTAWHLNSLCKHLPAEWLQRARASPGVILQVFAAHPQFSFRKAASFVVAPLKLSEVCDNLCSRLHPRPPERQIKTWAKAYQPVWFCSADYSVPVWLRTDFCWRLS